MDGLFGLFGAGGFAREVMPFVARSIERALGPDAGLAIRFVTHDPHAPAELNGVPVMQEEDFLASGARRWFNVAIGDGRVRARIAGRLQGVAQPLSLWDEGTRRIEPTEVGEGAVFCPYAMQSVNSRTGRFFQANLYAYVGHDCTVGDFVTFAPGAKCNGNVAIEDHVYVGAGAVIRQGEPGRPIVIGEGAVIGMGAVVTRSVAPGAVVVGNPAAALRR